MEVFLLKIKKGDQVKDVVAVILAAGESTRMKSELSKLLHPLGDHRLIEFPVQACVEANIHRIILVIGYQAERIKAVLGDKYEYVYQEKRLGTGDALRRATTLINDFKGELVVLPGDAPFISSSIIQELVLYHRKRRSAATILTAKLSDPGHYGRIIRDGYQSIKKIVESRNATEEELKIKEVNSGVYCFNNQKILAVLPLLQPNKVTGEVYLTDVIEILYSQGEKVEAFLVPDSKVVIGVNTPEDLKKACQLLSNKLTLTIRR